MSTLVPYAIPGDSATLKALFECDSLNNLLLKSMTEEKGSKISTSLKFNEGKLDYSLQIKPDTIYLPSDTIYLEKEVPVQVEVEKIEYRQTEWQIFRCRIGDITLILILLWGLWKLIKMKLKL